MRSQFIRALLPVLLGVPGVVQAQQAAPEIVSEKPFSGPFLPDRQKELSARSSRWSVELRESGFCHDCDHDRYRIVIRPLEGGPERTVSLDKNTRQIDEIHIAGSTGRAVILGRILPNSSIVHVVDLAAAVVIESFWCLRPEVSPSGRHIAFVKIYPAHFTGGVSDHVQIYDVASASAADSPRDHLIPAEAGQALYPPAPPNMRLANTGLPPGSVYRLLSDLFWLTDSRLAFVSLHQKTARLVVAEVTGAPALRTVDLPLAAAVDVAACPAFKSNPAAALHVRKIDQVQQVFRLGLGAVTPGCLLRETLEVPVP